MTAPEFSHVSVLLKETVDGLNVRPNGIYVDGTAGGGGHSFEIASRMSGGRLICLDRDPDAVAAAGERLKGFDFVSVVRSRFSKIDAVLDDLGIDKIDGLLLDLGVSSHQFDTAERGFSYHRDAPLDMRMSREGVSAADIVATYSEQALCDIFVKYSDEKFAPRIAREIVKQREIAPIDTTLKLADLISGCYPAKFKRDGNPSRKVFQALRIAVNGELDEERTVIEKGFKRLKSGGRMSIITFHSTEDRLVKQSFNELCRGCTCPPDFPVCVCGKTPKARLVNKKPITASETEIENNPRARSAKLRVLEKL
ncbi:MAG: 16S rRNA (cytosine(1402)-N(4))-methyltransferase RsmH [Acutalibacteraceae bacterium]